MSRKVWIDGKLYDQENAKISVYDHGLLYGDGVFEGIRVYQGKIFECDAHLHRLFDSARSIRLTPNQSREDLKTIMPEVVRANGLSDCYIRLILTRGVGYLGLNPNRCPTPSTIVIADTIDIYPKETYEKGMSIITASVIRNHPNAVSPRIKSLNYLNNILAKLEAADAGVPEAVMLNHDGNVSECSADNIFIVRGGQLQTPCTADGILEGVTRRVILDLAKKLGIDAVEKTIQRFDLYIAEECLLTGTAAEVVPVTKIDSRPIGTGLPGPITAKLKDAFARHVRAG
jgi:branched-chain amino acid aminotransferase